MKKKILEICAGNIESAIQAEAGGADRIELCAALEEGGITPSAGTIEVLAKELKIPVHVLIRPRGGDFCYSQTEVNIILGDIEVCKSYRVSGIVIGALLANGKIDKKTCSLFIEHARPLNCTFHRAFDVAADPFSALEEIIELGFDRILTSGQKPTAAEGLVLIAQLMRVAGESIIIMPGSGINENNILKIAGQTGAQEFHMSLRTAKQNSTREDLILQTSPYMITSASRVRSVREILDSLE